ncbi:MAG: hypothetical protein WC846_02695 [Candidatus Gracilibacteria bacterium]|jgi:hypothetical protein
MSRLSPAEQTIHQQFSEAGRSAREWLRKCALLLPEIERLQIWKKRGFLSLYEYAGKIAGMSRASVDDALWVLKRIADKPALMRVAEKKGISRVRPVATIATAETAGFWAKKADVTSKHALEKYVGDYRLEFRSGTESLSEKSPVVVAGQLANSPSAPRAVPLKKVTLELDPLLLAKLEKFRRGRSWNEAIAELLERSAKAPAQIVMPEPVKTTLRAAPVVIKRFVWERSFGLCSYPTCSRPASSLHHAQRFALEKIHDPARLHPVCTAHERLLHLGLVENEERPPSEWRLRTAPDRCDPKFYIDTLVSLYRPSG